MQTANPALAEVARRARQTRWLVGAVLGLMPALQLLFAVSMLARTFDVRTALMVLGPINLFPLAVMAGLYRWGFGFLPALVPTLQAVEAVFSGSGPDAPANLSEEARRMKLGCGLQSCVGGCLVVPGSIVLSMLLAGSPGWGLSLFVFGALPVSLALPVLLGRFLVDACDAILAVGCRLAGSLDPLPDATIVGPAYEASRLSWLRVAKSGRWLCICAVFIAVLSLVAAVSLAIFGATSTGSSAGATLFRMGAPALAGAFAGALFVLGVYIAEVGRTLEALVSAAEALRAARVVRSSDARPIPVARLTAAGGACRVFGHAMGASCGALGIGWGVMVWGRPASGVDALMLALSVSLVVILLGAMPSLLGSLAAALGSCLRSWCVRLHDAILACEQPDR